MYKKFLLLAIFSLTSCFHLTPYVMEFVKPHSSKQQIIQTLGQPSSEIIVSQIRILVYHVHKNILEMTLVKRFPFIGFMPLSRTGTEYWLLLYNDTLIIDGYKKDLLLNLPRAMQELQLSPLPSELQLNIE